MNIRYYKGYSVLVMEDYSGALGSVTSGNKV